MGESQKEIHPLSLMRKWQRQTPSCCRLSTVVSHPSQKDHFTLTLSLGVLPIPYWKLVLEASWTGFWKETFSKDFCKIFLVVKSNAPWIQSQKINKISLLHVIPTRYFRLLKTKVSIHFHIRQTKIPWDLALLSCMLTTGFILGCKICIETSIYDRWLLPWWCARMHQRTHV